MFTVALLGAESTGKTQLAAALAERFELVGKRTRVVQEPLRQWCDTQGRTPLPHEQWQIAHQHTQTLRQSDLLVDVLIADTTPLQTAAYSAYYFQDDSLDEYASQVHAQFFNTTLLMGTDLPWQPDPGQRSGVQAQAPVEAHLRRLLNALPHHPYALVYGHGATRITNAWRHVTQGMDIYQQQPSQSTTPARHSGCAGCCDPDCERQLFSRLKQS